MTYNTDGTITISRTELLAAGGIVASADGIDFDENELDKFAEGVFFLSVLLFDMGDHIEEALMENTQELESFMLKNRSEQTTS